MSRSIARLSAMAACTVAFIVAGPMAEAQNVNVNFGLHANTNVSAADLGIAVYPGAVLNQRPHDDAAFDLGLTLNDEEYRLRGVTYRSPDASAQVLAFYRNALSRYGQVLECDHGHAIGDLRHTDTGLSCRDDVNVGDHRSIESGHDLRVGSPHHFRLVAVDDTEPTVFVLMLAEIAHHH